MNEYLALFAIILSVTSCREKIDFDLSNGNTKIVIDGSITSENRRHSVKISKTSNYYDANSDERVQNASVIISDGTTDFTLTETEPGIYKTDSLSGEIGKTYTLKVSYEGITYSARSFLKEVAELQAIIAVQLFETIPIVNEVDSDYTVAMVINEPEGLGDYYLFKYYINNRLESDTVREYSFADDEFIDGLSFDTAGFNLVPIYFIESELVEVGDTVKLEVLSINEDYNDFLISVLLQSEFRGGLFDGPAANVGSNFDNGALGYFIASDVSSAETIITPQ